MTGGSVPAPLAALHGVSGARPLQATPAAPVADLLRDLGVPAADALASFVVFVGVVVLGWIVGRAVIVPLANRILAARNLGEHARRPLRKLVSAAVVFASIAVGFGLAGYGDFLTSLATIAAAATLAIGFAMQDILKNFVAGVFIYTDRPFKIGDWIEWGDHAGVVEDISMRVTRVRTFDNELLTVPNAVLTSDVVKNPVAKDQLRLKFVFGIAYDADIERATEIIVEEAAAHDEILADPAPSVRLTEMGDSHVGLQSRIWIANPSRSDFVKIRGEYVTAVKQRFDEEGVDIPFPTRTIEGGLELGGELVTGEAPTTAD